MRSRLRSRAFGRGLAESRANGAGRVRRPADAAGHDVMGAARAGDPYGRTPVLVDVGREDGFRFADEELATESPRPRYRRHLPPGGRGGWRDRMGDDLRFYSAALARCRSAQ